ncbi:MAG TPA: flippase, partial [Thermoleophilaceae bacterium]
MRSRLAQRVAANTTAQLAGKAAVLTIAAGSIAILTRYLGPGDYGRYVLAMSVMQLFGVAADAGLTTIVVRESSRHPDRAAALVGNALTLRLLLSLLAIVVAGLVSLALPYEPSVRIAILIAGMPLLFGMLTSAVTAVLQTDLRMGRAAIAEVVGRAAAFAAVIGVVLLDLGFYAAIGAAGVGAATTLAVTWVLTRPLAELGFRAAPATWKRLLGASLPVGIALALNELYVRADTIIISLYRSIDEVGFYSLAYRILEVTSLLGAAFLTSVFPLMSRHAHTDRARFRATVQGAWDAFVILGMPVAVCGAVLAPQIVELAGGADFAGAAKPLRFLFTAGALAFVNGVIGYALIAVDRQRKALWLNVLGLATNVGLNLLLVPKHGIVAAAVITVSTELLVLA